ncbi:DUF427-domain-containing protein [Rhizophagus irregularis]|uniref:DUF427-domain-containing protein n=3 Tax=Rhizophagus irregularis TaxID=588596 RepID=A0A2I1EAP7_9GLOM|nr:hypothetical protein GLOIN_2v1728042 [Rhizophagus irregularis DAOM 181602=DAOM 197198]EXX61976.1 hypothetical protein RirG_166070 [Rhizophagus irregularis DAOM 197198w]PKC18019.1 DUF427-domain-containing protein [Rhizophagus irregularis]PKC71923.1 DUF427-domain-containing protein [Rhizophagus irregularis]PKK77994.1 DUF427-domain-containing protein [Rhizophagus irregularis]PKY19206.1 DUF427-domain-containing protein [Rhizophagus irregularis]|eukprot:XP_025165617.1 hypothetical protein GLOIN_2v1728042 [Rhizophagus irregularis DAOM 181602=DAOM 197198]
MPKAEWNGEVIAESDDFQEVEGSIYFPPNSVKSEFLQTTSHNSTCPWKGVASYYNIVVNGKTNENAAWYYPKALEKAKNIENYVAFWKGVKVTK